MPSIGKKRADTYDDMVDAYMDAISELNDAIDEFNEQYRTLFDNVVQEKLDTANACMQQLQEFAEEIRDDLQGQFDEKSDNWQSGDRGIAFSEWIEQWDAITYLEPPGVNIDDMQLEVVNEESIEAESELDY